MWEIDIVDVGTIPQLPLAQFLPDADSRAVIDVPCFAYLLTTAEHTVLIDTGPDARKATDAGFTVRGDGVHALVRALSGRGRTPSAVEWIIHTHLHYDHMQNDPAFADARVAVQEEEVRWGLSPDADEFYLDIGRFVASLGKRLVFVASEQRILPGITVMRTGGHTPGHQAVLVQATSGQVCIAGDIVPMKANLTVPAPSADPQSVCAFLKRVRSEAWEVLPSHDPDLRVLAVSEDIRNEGRAETISDLASDCP